MPNSYGALNLAEMRDRVWRRINAVRNTSVTALNVEGGTKILDPLVTNEDMNMYLSTALTMRFIDISEASPSTFSDERVINIMQNQVEYQLPEDIAFLRAVYWKQSSITHTIVPPSERELMYEFNADTDKDTLLPLMCAPTYRRRLGMLVLNEVPQESNTGGILIEYIKQILPLNTDEQYLEFPLANMLQEVMIADAVVEIVEERMQLDASMLKGSRDLKLERLIRAASMQKMPKFIQLVVSAYPMARRRGW